MLSLRLCCGVTTESRGSDSSRISVSFAPPINASWSVGPVLRRVEADDRVGDDNLDERTARADRCDDATIVCSAVRWSGVGRRVFWLSE